VAEVRFIQSWNILLPPIAVTELGIVMEVRPVQPWNAELLMLLTEFGIVMEVRPVQPWNAEVPM